VNSIACVPSYSRVAAQQVETQTPVFAQTLAAREQLDRALDAPNLKYGKNTVYYGGSHNAPHAAPMRIAFNHVPDLVIESDTGKQAGLSLRGSVNKK
jgi:hypothetical protein